MTILHADLRALHDALDSVDRDARDLLSGMSEDLGTWRPHPGSWSVAECLDHLAVSNGVYLEAMRGSAERAVAAGRKRRGPAVPGVVGGWFVRYLEPPVRRLKTPAPRTIRPRAAPSLEDASGRFFASQDEAREFLRRFADIDLAGIRFPNPIARGVRFSLATGLHVIAAHDRRHLWQARRVRAAAPTPSRPYPRS